MEGFIVVKTTVIGEIFQTFDAAKKVAASRNEQAMSSTVDGQIIPPAIAAELPRFNNFVVRCARCRCQNQHGRQHNRLQQDQRDSYRCLHSHTCHPTRR